MCNTGKCRNYSLLMFSFFNKIQNSQQGRGLHGWGTALWGGAGVLAGSEPTLHPGNKGAGSLAGSRNMSPNSDQGKGLFPLLSTYLEIIYSFLHPQCREPWIKWSLLRAELSRQWGTPLQKATSSRLCSASRTEALRGSRVANRELIKQRQACQSGEWENRCQLEHKGFSMDANENISPEKVRQWDRLPREVTQPSSEEVFKIQQERAQKALIHLTAPQTTLAFSRRLEWRSPELSPIHPHSNVWAKIQNLRGFSQDCTCRLVA